MGAETGLLVFADRDIPTALRAAAPSVGCPPYGYVADKTSHPVPARRERQDQEPPGARTDPRRRIRHIFDLYLGSGMGLLLMAERLGALPAKALRNSTTHST